MRARAWLQERRAEWGGAGAVYRRLERAGAGANVSMLPICPRTRFPAALWQACQDALKQARSRQRIPSASVHSARSPAPRSVQRSHAAPQVPCASPPSPGSPLRHGGQPAAPQPPRRASPPSVPRAARRRLSPVHGHKLCAHALQAVGMQGHSVQRWLVSLVWRPGARRCWTALAPRAPAAGVVPSTGHPSAGCLCCPPHSSALGW